MKPASKLSSGERRAAIIKAVQRVFAEKGFHGTTTRALADAAGEAVARPVRPDLGGWFAHHLAAVIMLNLLPATPVVDYGVSRVQLVEQIVWFSLRGLGLKDDAIRRHYNPKALALFGG